MPPESSFEPTELDQIRHALDAGTPAPEGRAMLADFWTKHGDALSAPIRSRRTMAGVATTSRRHVVGISMAVCATIALIATWYHGRDVAIPVAEYAAAVGTTTRVTLSDGTRVVLAPATRIRVHGRDVTLEGEAKFVVTHGIASPFSVTVPATATHQAVVTRVLGTEFAIRAYDNDVRVAVSDGRVAVQGVVANANTIVRVDNTGTHTAVGPTRDALAFADGNLVLTDVPLREAAKDFARWFGVEIRFTDPRIGDYPISGTFTPNSAASLNEILTHTLPVRAERQGGVLTLYPRVRGAGERHGR